MRILFTFAMLVVAFTTSASAGQLNWGDNSPWFTTQLKNGGGPATFTSTKAKEAACKVSKTFKINTKVYNCSAANHIKVVASSDPGCRGKKVIARDDGSKNMILCLPESFPVIAGGIMLVDKNGNRILN